MYVTDKEKDKSSRKREKGMLEESGTDACSPGIPFNDAVPMIIHVRPDLYRAFMRCVWMHVYENHLSPLDAQNMLIEDFLRHHGC